MVSFETRVAGSPTTDQSALRLLSRMAATKHYPRGAMVYAPGDPAEYRYSVVSGVARRLAISADGQRRIIDILLPGDFFGFSPGATHNFEVDAATADTTIASYPRLPLDSRAQADPVFGRVLHNLASEEIARLQARILALGLTTSLAKVKHFLLEMAARASDGSPDHLVLLVSRCDIADYLALSVETVSRALTRLKHIGAIKITGARCITILNRSVLKTGWDA